MAFRSGAFRSGVLVALLLAASQSPAGVFAAGPTIKGDPQAGREVEAAFEKILGAKSWRSRMSGPGAGGMVMTTEYMAPDRYHMTMQQGSNRMEIFMVGRQVWTRAEGSCSRMPAAPGIRNPKEIIEHNAPNTTITVSRLGPATIDGMAVQGYALVVESQGTTAREKFYVGADGWPRRLEMESPRGVVYFDYFDFNAPITITDPPC